MESPVDVLCSDGYVESVQIDSIVWIDCAINDKSFGQSTIGKVEWSGD